MRGKLAALLGATAVVWAGLAAPAYAADGVKLSVLHAVPGLTVDVYVNGKRTLNDFKPGMMAGPLKLAAGTVNASVAAAGDTKALIGPADVAVKEGVNTIVYAWGSLEDDNLKLAVQTISGLHSSPGGVNAGEVGLAADRSPLPLMAGGLLLLGAGAFVGRRRLSAVRSGH